MLCDRLPGAAVLGLHEPYIAVPSSLLQVLSAADLDQVILHEYGHVQRRDDWMRLLQGLVQSALWIHPAAFLIGRELDLEREVACDDWVIARTGAPRDYAGCLSRVAESRRGRVMPAFAPALFGGRRDLIRRVDRLLDSRRNARHQPVCIRRGRRHLPGGGVCRSARVSARGGGGGGLNTSQAHLHDRRSDDLPPRRWRGCHSADAGPR